MKRLFRIIILAFSILLLTGIGISISLDSLSVTWAYSRNEKEIQLLRQQNEGRLAEEYKIIPTTDQAVVFTFAGIANDEALDDVLNRLDKIQVHATFFVFEKEAKLYTPAVQRILAAGHEIGIAIRPTKDADFFKVSNEIIRTMDFFKNRFDYEAKFIKQPWGQISDATKEAVSALGYTLIGQSVNVVQGKHKDYSNTDDVMKEIFGKYVYSLGRGQIVHFRMDYYSRSLLVGEMIEVIKKQKIDNIAYDFYDDNPRENIKNDSAYLIKSVGAVFDNLAKRYSYPVDDSLIPTLLKPTYRSFSLDNNNFKQEMMKRYIGAPHVDEADRTIGFNKREQRRLDQSGLIHQNENAIFLTFDDWGNDSAINKLMYVLRKHQVVGTFFVITRNVNNNPNLLRSLAEQGHDIASHSEAHKPMAVRNENNKYVSIQNFEEYYEDVGTAYQKLANIVGDVEVDGKYSLTRYFRPPTLAISKEGMQAIYLNGYEYIVSGSCSTEDYAATSVSQVVNNMQRGIYDRKTGIQKGAILVMHMSDTAAYTARALDLLLTANEQRADSDPLKFKVGRLADYLKDGYSQTRDTSQ